MSLFNDLFGFELFPFTDLAPYKEIKPMSHPDWNYDLAWGKQRMADAIAEVRNDPTNSKVNLTEDDAQRVLALVDNLERVVRALQDSQRQPGMYR